MSRPRFAPTPNDVDFVTNRESAHILSDSVDGACCLIAETCRKLDGLDVVVDPPHGFGAVDADRLDLDTDLVGTWGRNLNLDELENLRSSRLCEFDQIDESRRHQPCTRRGRESARKPR
jgi:hypothetical protein